MNPHVIFNVIFNVKIVLRKKSKKPRLYFNIVHPGLEHTAKHSASQLSGLDSQRWVGNAELSYP